MKIRFDKRLALFTLPFVVGTLVHYSKVNTWVTYVFFLLGLFYGVYLTVVNSIYAIWIILILGQDWFGLVPLITIGSGTLHWNEVSAVFAVLFFLTHFKSCRFYRFGVAYIILFGFIGNAIIQSKLIYGQDIITTVLTCRSYFISIAFWPMMYFVEQSHENKRRFLDIVMKVAEITMVLSIITWIVENCGIHITYFQVNIRWGMRIYIAYYPILFYFFYHAYLLIYKNKKGSLRNYLFSFFVIVFVYQTRIIIISMLATTAIMLLLANRVRKLFQYSVATILTIVFLLTASPQLRTIVINTVLDYINDGGTMRTRVKEREYFDELLKGHVLWGVGIPNAHNTNSIEYRGVDNHGYYVGDLGTYQLKYRFGILAPVLYYILLASGIIATFKYRKTASYAFIGCAMFIFYILISGITCNIGTNSEFMIAMVFAEAAGLDNKYNLHCLEMDVQESL